MKNAIGGGGLHPPPDGGSEQPAPPAAADSAPLPAAAAAFAKGRFSDSAAIYGVEIAKVQSQPGGGWRAAALRLRKVRCIYMLLFPLQLGDWLPICALAVDRYVRVARNRLSATAASVTLSAL